VLQGTGDAAVWSRTASCAVATGAAAPCAALRSRSRAQRTQERCARGRPSAHGAQHIAAQGAAAELGVWRVCRTADLEPETLEVGWAPARRTASEEEGTRHRGGSSSPSAPRSSAAASKRWRLAAADMLSHHSAASRTHLEPAACLRCRALRRVHPTPLSAGAGASRWRSGPTCAGPTRVTSAAAAASAARQRGQRGRCSAGSRRLSAARGRSGAWTCRRELVRQTSARAQQQCARGCTRRRPGI
jgi:hypothetical protein